MVCDPKQPSWTDAENSVIRICESMLRTFYMHDDLDTPTEAFQQCGAWDDPDPVLEAMYADDDILKTKIIGFASNTDSS